MDDAKVLTIMNTFKGHFFKRSQQYHDKVQNWNEVDENSSDYNAGYSDAMDYAWATMKDILSYTKYDDRTDE